MNTAERLNEKAVTLFDNSTKSGPEYMQEGESTFRFMNRSPRTDIAEIRERYEQWFVNYPTIAQRSLRSRFRGSDSQHRGAAFELFMHEMLIQMGCAVTPLDLEGKHPMPDFEVEFRGKRCVVEVTTVDPDSDGLKMTGVEQQLLSLLKSIPSSDFRISYEQRGRLSRTLGKKQVVQPFEQLLASHDPDEVQQTIDVHGMDARPSETIRDGNWQLRGRLLPLPAPSRVGQPRSSWMGGPGKSAMGSGSKPLMDAVLGKASKYGHLNLPLVVAINCRHMTFDMESGLPEALLGKTREPRPELKHLARNTAYRAGGVWADLGFKPKHGQLAGVLAFNNVHPWNLDAQCGLFLSPFRDKGTLPDCLFELPVVEVASGEIQWKAGRHATDFLSTA